MVMDQAPRETSWNIRPRQSPRGSIHTRKMTFQVNGSIHIATVLRWSMRAKLSGLLDGSQETRGRRAHRKTPVFLSSVGWLCVSSPVRDYRLPATPFRYIPNAVLESYSTQHLIGRALRETPIEDLAAISPLSPTAAISLLTPGSSIHRHTRATFGCLRSRHLALLEGLAHSHDGICLQGR